MATVSAVTATALAGVAVNNHHRQKLLSSRLTLRGGGGGGEGRANLRAPAIDGNTRRAGTGSRRRGAALKVNAYEERDNDGPAIKVDLSLSDVKKGKKIGGGSFGDVFEGKYQGQAVVLKERKMNGPGKKFFDSEAALNRRLKNSAGVASFIGGRRVEVGGEAVYPCEQQSTHELKASEVSSRRDVVFYFGLNPHNFCDLILTTSSRSRASPAAVLCMAVLCMSHQNKKSRRVAPLLVGVAGANAYLVWKDEVGRVTVTSKRTRAELCRRTRKKPKNEIQVRKSSVRQTRLCICVSAPLKRSSGPRAASSRRLATPGGCIRPSSSARVAYDDD